MRLTLCVALLTGFTCSVSAAAISYSSQPLGAANSDSGTYRLTFDVRGVSFQAGQELDIRFDPSVYRVLSNAAGPSGFDILLIQPNNPLGAFGDFSALALRDFQSTSLRFSLDVIASAAPSSQLFRINQLDSSGVVVRTLESGFTVVSDAPEPSTAGLISLAIAVGGFVKLARARVRR